VVVPVSDALLAENARLRLLVASYRLLAPRLIDAARERAQQPVSARPQRCDSEHPDGWRCDRMAGHQDWHVHAFSGDGRLSWCDR
jgi:hypothetical protein